MTCTGSISLSTQAEVDAFPTTYGCNEITGNITIASNTITNLDSLYMLNTIGGFLNIFENDLLQNINGLSNLNTIGNYIRIKSNDVLLDIDGLSGLTAFANFLEVQDNGLLSSLSGLSNVSNGCDFFLIKDNPSLLSLDGLNFATNIAGSMYIDNNALLSDLQGLNNLTSTGMELVIANNAILNSLSGLENLLDINGYLFIDANDMLVSLDGLDNLSSIGNNFFLQNNQQLLDLTALNNLNYVAGDLAILNNPLLPELTGLENICYIGDDLTVQNNSSLSVCCSVVCWEHLVQGNLNIFTNNSGCNTLMEVQNNCTSYLCPPQSLNLRAFLAGGYNTNTQKMNTTLLNDNLIPLTQPYASAPWNYNGTESFNTIADFPSNTVDWVLVELRTGSPATSGNVPGTTLIERQAGILNEEGYVVGIDGNEMSFVNLTKGNEYHILLRHRNHIDVISTGSLAALNGLSYDFTTADTQAFGSLQQTSLGNGKYGLISGDFTGDGVIQVSDFDAWKYQAALLYAYFQTDADLDGSVQTTDYDAWFTNTSKMGVVDIRY